jgi:hypothetical protein
MSGGGLFRGSGIAVVALVGLCGGVVVLGSAMAVQQETPVRSEYVEREAVRAMTAACPELFAGSQKQTWVTMASIPGLPGQDDSGSYTLTIDGRKKPAGTVSAIGESTEVMGFPPRPTHATVTALGGLAPGSVVGRSSEDLDGEGQGLSSAQCTQPSSRLWLVGGGTTKGQRDRVVLVNPTDSDAIVNLDIYGPSGRVEATGTDGISVRAHEREEIQLDALVVGAEALAVRVTTKVGLISGFIADELMEDLTPRGTEIIGEAGSPQKRSVVAGLPAGRGQREIVVFSPEQDGRFRLRALTADGPVELVDGQEIQIRSGRVRVLDLTEDLNGRAASIEVVGDVPMLATANMKTKETTQDSATRRNAVAKAEAVLENAKGAAAKATATRRLSEVRADNADAGSDVIWLSTGPRLRHLGVATALLPQTDAAVSIVALDGDVDVKVSVLGRGKNSGELKLQREVSVASDTSREVEVASASGSTYSVVVERISGPGSLYASHQQAGRGRAITGYALAQPSPRIAFPDAGAVYGVPN